MNSTNEKCRLLETFRNYTDLELMVLHESLQMALLKTKWLDPVAGKLLECCQEIRKERE
jgi:hypothetical protein